MPCLTYIQAAACDSSCCDAASPPDRFQHLGIGGGEVFAQAPQALMAGELLDYVQRHPPAYGGLGQAPAEAMGRDPFQANPGTGGPEGLVCGLTRLRACGAASGREQRFSGGGSVAVLDCPGSPVVDQSSPQRWGDRHLTGLAGFGGDGPIGEATVDVCPAQGQGFGDAGSSPALNRPQAGVAGRWGSGQQLIQLGIGQGAGLAVAIDLHWGPWTAPRS